MAQMKNVEDAGSHSFGFLIQSLARDIDAKMKVALKEVDVDVKVFANFQSFFMAVGNMTAFSHI